MKDKKNKWILSAIGLIIVIYLSLLLAPIMNNGLANFIKKFPELMASPFKLNINDDSLRVCLIFQTLYLLFIFVYITIPKNYRRREEHGSAQWGNTYQINKKYCQKPIGRRVSDI